MEALDFKLEFKENNENFILGIPAVIVAAGSSLRMQGINKQFVSLCGVPAIVHTLKAFQGCKYISEIILVTKAEFIADIQKFADKYMISKLTDIVEGGSCRGESVINGLNRIKNSKYVMIHDGARPLVKDDIIKAVFEALKTYDCAIPVVPVKDTIKEINGDKSVTQTLNREKLVAVQTPQGVNLEKYLSVISGADLNSFTDDASIMESAGHTVITVEGDYENIKITTPEDVVIAEFYLEKRGEV